MPNNGKPAQDDKGRFLTGNSGGGRPKGARQKLGEKFLEDLFEAWDAKGIAAINQVISERPQDFLKVVASILPKEIAAEITHRYVALMPARPDGVDEWQKQHTPRLPPPMQ